MVEALSKYLWLIPLFPAAGAFLNGVFGRVTQKNAHWIAVPAVFLSFLFSIIASVSYSKQFPISKEAFLFNWIASEALNVPFGFLFDGLSCTMLLVITGVGFLVHLYSVGYMHDDKGYARYFCYLNLFIFFMLILVLAENYLLMFMGWEGVGLCSYLLIGFWFHKKSAADAAKKAFIVNRIGDAGFLVGLFLIFHLVGNFSYLHVKEIGHYAHHDPELLPFVTAIALCLFVGAIGKSAQIPLYVWLPDAMEGPTPVSALIHAATMVTAGIYMVCRSSFLYHLSPLAMETIAVIGVLTALFAGMIALVQNDIKKVLAYSTVSQLGFMFLALGVGAFASGMFHLVTHAFFKGLLFLGAGSVIHAASGEQDIQKLGGLKKHIPVTFVTFLIGTLAISGIPPLAGFWSKDEILAQTFHAKHLVLFCFAAFAALLTSFYMFRLLYLVFFGKTRLPEKAVHHLHESPKTMTIPLVLLAFLSVVGGMVLGFPPEHGILHRFLEYSLTAGHESSGIQISLTNGLLMGTSVAIAVLGWFLAWLLYCKRTDLPKELAGRMTAFYTFLLHKGWVDELYDKTVLALCRAVSKASFVCDRVLIDGTVNGVGSVGLFLSKVKFAFDKNVIDGIANGIATVTERSSSRFRKIQTGGVQNYALTMVGGVVVLIGLVLFVFK